MMHEPDLNDRDFRQFRELIYNLSGISLADGKRQMLQSRLRRRLRHHNFSSFGQYYDMVADLSEDSDEIRAMINCVTTNKTDFFRESHHFDFVRDRVVDEIAKQASLGIAPRRIRMWHAGCSTGEEPYSMAMTLREALSGRGDWDVKLLASDIDTDVIEHAAAGIYDTEKTAGIPADLLHRYFLRSRSGDGRYLAKPALKDWIAFRQINLLDPVWPMRPDVKFDIILCRNVVIYFDKPTQRRLFRRFFDLIRPGGYLFIGHSESLFGVSEDFKSLGHTIYQTTAELPPCLLSLRQHCEVAK